MTRKPLTFHCLLHAADLVEDDLRKRLARVDLRPEQARVIDALDRRMVGVAAEDNFATTAQQGIGAANPRGGPQGGGGMPSG